ncbi:gem-associated protein 8-like [Saccostrea cucullata]|uniref:gem-associated protein 8-like n=1 Tax=Saccostrea cuccullata TaxID=36930 RepID=UPI002ED2F385
MEESDSSMTSVDPSSRSDPSLTQSKTVLVETEQGQSSDITISDSDTIATDLNNTLTSLTPDPDLSNTDVDYSAGVKGSKEDQSCTSCMSSSCFTDESTDESSPQKRSKNVPEFSSQNWHMNKCFNRYWKHYYQSMAWCKRHFYVMKHMSSYNMNYSHPFYQMNMPNPMTPPNLGRGQQFKKAPGEGRGRGHGRSRGGLRRGTGQYKNAANRHKQHGLSNQTKPVKQPQETESDLAGVDSDDSEVYEMEVTKEMVQFFAHSHEHRKKRDASKEIIGEDGTVQKRIQIEEVKANKKAPTIEAPSERPGVRRTAEMMKLYGKGAAMIHGMETAIQMTYDRTMDIKQPKFWPNMPLKIVFS